MKTQEKLTGLLGCRYPKTTLCCLTHRAGECSICPTASSTSKCHSSECSALLVCAPTKKTCRIMVVVKTIYMEKRKKIRYKIKSQYRVYRKFLTGLRFSFTKVERTKYILIGIFLTWFATKTTEEPTRP